MPGVSLSASKSGFISSSIRMLDVLSNPGRLNPGDFSMIEQVWKQNNLKSESGICVRVLSDKVSSGDSNK